MLNFGCTNGSLVGEANYRSPVPVIGVYIAAASLGSLLLIVCDVFFARRQKKRWLPCKWFALNSVTLTLLSIAAKLTVDLTSPMPSRWDQLSKLTGTAFICIGMGIIVPSMGVNSESEGFTNMMALTIFVITVTVNICIQLSTGVIFTFVVEHIILLGLMMLLLLMLWNIYFEIRKIKRIDADFVHTSFITNGSASMLERLKVCYVHAFCSNPQLRISMFPMNMAVCSLCVACTSVIIEAAFRSLILNKLEYCEGVSDYKWSMRYIVIIQIFTAVLGCILIVIRCVAMAWLIDGIGLEPFMPPEDHKKQMNQTLKAHRLLNFFGYIPTRVPTGIALIAQALIAAPWYILYRSISGRSLKDDDMEKFEGNILVVASKFSVRKDIDEMIRLMNQVSDSNLVYQTSPLRPPSQYLSWNFMRIEDGGHMIEISALSMALLVKTAEASISKRFIETLVIAFGEVKEIIDYICKTRQSHESGTGGPSTDPWVESEKREYARAVWIGGDLRCMLPAGYTEPSTDHMVAIDTMNELKKILCKGHVWKDLGRVIDFINRRSYVSIEDLCEEIKQLFADMLHALLAQIPNAIFNNIIKTRGEDYEDTVRVAIKLLFKIQSCEYQDVWPFPAGMTGIVDSSWENTRRREDSTSELQRLEEIGPRHLSIF